MRTSRSLWALALCLACTACGDDSQGASSPTPPVERSAEVTANAAFFATVRAAGKARKRGDLEEAVRLYREALAAKPEHEASLVDLARTLRELGRRLEGLEVLEQLHRLHPDLSRPHFLLAEVLTENPQAGEADLTRALSLYERALEIEPNISGPRLAMARLHLRRGDAHLAETAYRTVLGTNPDSQEALNGLSLVLLKRSAPAEAVPFLVRSLQIGTRAKGRRDVPSEMDTASSFDAGSLASPANKTALDALARAAKTLGGYPESVPQAFRVAPTNSR